MRVRVMFYLSDGTKYITGLTVTHAHGPKLKLKLRLKLKLKLKLRLKLKVSMYLCVHICVMFISELSPSSFTH